MSASIDQLRERIRRAGLRATGARLAVLDHLLSHEAPQSHGEVAEALAERGFDRATLFRNLNDLTAAGLVHRFDAGDHTWRFEPAEARRHEGQHAHFVCTDCGSVQCLSGVDVRVETDAAPTAVARQAVQVQLRGVCDDCA